MYDYINIFMKIFTFSICLEFSLRIFSYIQTKRNINLIGNLTKFRKPSNPN